MGGARRRGLATRDSLWRESGFRIVPARFGCGERCHLRGGGGTGRRCGGATVVSARGSQAGPATARRGARLRQEGDQENRYAAASVVAR